MTDIELYHDLKNRIIELEAHNKQLQTKIYNLNKQIPVKPLSRGAKALIEIKKIKIKGFAGSVNRKVHTLALKHHLSPSYIMDLWYKGE